MTKTLFLDDLAVGQRFASTTSVTLTEADIIAYAKQFDPQPFHTDPEAAKSTFFGGLAASGWHTAALSMRLLVDSSLHIAGGHIGAGGEISWPRPTRPGDTLRVVYEIVEVKPSKSRPDRGMITVKAETLNQNDEVVQLFVVKMVVPRKVS
ncbi:MAG: MaoC family dehydratase [Rhodospirillaceae bacterium]|nr:MaoC family dehydratase [Rhodospirillaceae bacterium]